MSITYESPNQYMSDNTSLFSTSDNEATPSFASSATASTVQPSIPMNQEFMNVIQSRQLQGFNKNATFYRHQNIEDLKPIDSSTMHTLMLNKQLLIIDVRAYSYFAKTRIRSAINVSIPSVLLKRPAYSLEKVCESITYDEKAADRLRLWSQATHIVFYDHSSYSPSDSGNSTTAILLGSKLRSAGYKGQLNYLQGGLKVFYELHVNQCEIGPFNQQPPVFNRSKRPTNIQLPLPTSQVTSGVNPFFTNIRQNLELSHGPLKERFDVRLPWGLLNKDGAIYSNSPLSLSSHHPRFGLAGSSVDVKGNLQLPNWIRDIMDTENGPKKLAEMYELLERTEQKRLSTIMKHHSKQSNDDHFPFSIASSMEKGALNRYNNIWPYEYSRVRLNQTNDDYINANYIQYATIKKDITIDPISQSDHEIRLAQEGLLTQASLRTMDRVNVGLDCNRKYISTQGPLPTTFNDFWKMVWDENSQVIVMLTQEMEMNKIKCHQYWPSTMHVPEKYGAYTVTLLSESTKYILNMNDKRERNEDDLIMIRKFSLKHEGQDERMITQLQYTGWTDFGVPDQPIGILELVHQADAASREDMGPMIVHCSAGCGRSGTFCVIDTIIQRLWHERDVYTCSSTDKINQTVSRFREQRMSMVQTHRQYVFCYEVVLWWLLGYGNLPVSQPTSPSVSIESVSKNSVESQERPSSIGSMVDDFKE
ncbi:hypothetical protein INT47_008999, partial [Mucor saturninus]